MRAREKEQRRRAHRQTPSENHTTAEGRLNGAFGPSSILDLLEASANPPTLIRRRLAERRAENLRQLELLLEVFACFLSEDLASNERTEEAAHRLGRWGCAADEVCKLLARVDLAYVLAARIAPRRVLAARVRRSLSRGRVSARAFAKRLTALAKEAGVVAPVHERPIGEVLDDRLGAIRVLAEAGERRRLDELRLRAVASAEEMRLFDYVRRTSGLPRTGVVKTLLEFVRKRHAKRRASLPARRLTKQAIYERSLAAKRRRGPPLLEDAWLTYCDRVAQEKSKVTR